MKGVPGFRFNSKKGKAYFEVTLPKTGGAVRRRKAVRAVSMQQALDEWKRFRETVLAGRGAQPFTFREYVRKFWPKIEKRLARKMAHDESLVVKKVLTPFFGDTELRSFNPAVLHDFVADQKSKQYSPATINGRLSILRMIINDARDRGIPDIPAIRHYPMVKETPLRLEFSEEERRRFLAAFDDEAAFRRLLAAHRQPPEPVKSRRFKTPRPFGGSIIPEGIAAGYYFERFRASKPIFVVALETGLRRGDLLDLKWSSVHEDWIRVIVGKTQREAIVPISAVCRAALTECRQRTVVAEYVFLTDEGRRYSVATVARHFRKAKKLADIKRRFRFHDLRHSFASRLASSGVTIQVIAKALGHSSVAMSERYARPSDEAMRSVLDALDGHPSHRNDRQNGKR